jgi:8-oxo-dGTP diphosphatase
VILGFDELELDAANLKLRRAGQLIKADALVVRLLLALARNTGRVLTREELVEQVWAGRPVADNVIAVSMARLRKTLGHKRGDREFVVTIFGHGYRFVREVTARKTEATSSAAVRTASEAGPPFVGRERVLAGLLQALDDARAGRGRLCALMGEPGIGKTRVVETPCATTKWCLGLYSLSLERQSGCVRTRMRHEIRAEIVAIEPLDALEREHIDDALAWIDSGAELCRLAKPATPPKHLVSYCAVVDAAHVLLVDHRNARLWLPPGGHVEPGEHPRATVLRELHEELGLAPSHAIQAPLMVTCTKTVGLTAGHTDVSLWYIVRASCQQQLKLDEQELNAMHWFPLAEVPLLRTDPHMTRFLAKLGSTGCT